MSDLGVLADHHWTVCVPLPITRQRGLFGLLVCRGTPFLLRYGCFLSPYPSWRAPSGSSLALPFWVVCHPSKTLPPKEPWQKPQNRSSPLPTTKPCSFTSDPWPHCVLYWLGTGWWDLGLACAFLPYVSKIYLPLCHSPWSRGLLAQLAVLFFDLLCELLLISRFP